MRPCLIASQKGTHANVLVNSVSGTKRLSGSSLWEEGLLLAWSHDGEGTPETPPLLAEIGKGTRASWCIRKWRPQAKHVSCNLSAPP